MTHFTEVKESNYLKDNIEKSTVTSFRHFMTFSIKSSKKCFTERKSSIFLYI